MIGVLCGLVAAAANESWTAKLELGTVGEWTSGLATAGALIGTLFVLRKENTALAQQAAEQRSAETARMTAQAATDEQLELARKQQAATGEQLGLAREQARISRDALRNSLRPFLVDVPIGVFRGRQDILFDDGTASVYVEDAATIVSPSAANPPTRGRLSLSVRNIGKGAAIITGLSIDLGGLSWGGKMSRSIVPPNEHTRLTFTVPINHPDLVPLLDAMDGTGQSFDVVVGYTDLSGTEKLTTRLMFHLLNGQWKIRQLSVADGVTTVVSGPADG